MEVPKERFKKSFIWVIRSAQIGCMIYLLRNALSRCVKAQDRSLPYFYSDLG